MNENRKKLTKPKENRNRMSSTSTITKKNARATHFTYYHYLIYYLKFKLSFEFSF
jgi:hypothetical protein